MAKVRVHASAVAFALAIAGAATGTEACSALTGVDKYDVNDCPKGDCSEAGSSSSGGDAAADGTTTTDGAVAADVAADTFACAAGTALVTLTLTGQTATVTVDQSGIVLVPPNPGSQCLPLGQVRLRASGGKGTWTCVSGCTDSQSDTDQFTFQNPTTGSTITANLQN
jgi:hypothetical protein